MAKQTQNRTSKAKARRRSVELTDEQWRSAQSMWENDSVREMTAAEVASAFQVGAAVVKARCRDFRWTRNRNKVLVHVPRARPAWRPPSFRDEYAQQMMDYFNVRYFNSAENLADADAGRVVADIDDRRAPVSMYRRFPTLPRFAQSIGVTQETLYDWAHKKLPDGTLRYPDFSYAYQFAKSVQAAVATEGGTAGLLQPAFTAFAAKNLIGWTDAAQVAKEAEAVGRIDIHKDVYAQVRMRARIEEIEAEEDELPAVRGDSEE